MRRAALIGALAAALLASAAPPAAADSWRERVASARDFAEDRRGRVAFAFVDERGRLRGGLDTRERFHSASLVKAMLLVAYLDRGSVRGRALSEGEEELLGEMTRRSGNRAATRVRSVVTNAGLRRVARRARMRDFATAGSWGSSIVTAADQARFFFRVDRLAPRRHRVFARAQLAGIARSQRWGVGQAVPDGWTAYFKGAWRPEGDARLVHQGALLRRRGTRVALAVLTDGQPWHGYGTLTVRGIARRLLRDGPPEP
ncbi:MAG: hypothetical protein WD844_05175 [Thermoleophilaceae bacterium]